MRAGDRERPALDYLRVKFIPQSEHMPERTSFKYNLSTKSAMGTNVGLSDDEGDNGTMRVPAGREFSSR